MCESEQVALHDHKMSGVLQAAMMKEIFNRGPISCGIDAGPLLKYTSGIARWGNVIILQVLQAYLQNIYSKIMHM